jgi:hypothetical protein
MIEKQDHQFLDNKDKMWTIDISSGCYMLLNSKHGIDISKVFDQKDNWLTTLLAQDDMVQFLVVLGEVCKTERVECDITEEDFYNRLTGDILGPAADALIEGFTNFLPAHKRSALRTVTSGMKKGLQQVSDKITEKAGKLDGYLENQFESELDVLLEKLSSEGKIRKPM